MIAFETDCESMLFYIRVELAGIRGRSQGEVWTCQHFEYSAVRAI